MTNKKTKAIFFVLFLLFIYLFPTISESSSGSVRYQVHLQDKGWVNTVYDGEVGGTTGEARRMEAIAIALSGVDGKLSYKVHCETYGWMNRTSEGVIAGTTGQGKRMEAIIIYLENSSYDIKYRVHVQDYGWMNWVSSGQVAGTTGQSKRIEAIQIKLEKKNETSTSVIENTVSIKENSSKMVNTEKNAKLGIDVSKHQGDIDWSKVKKSGVNFAMIRCAYRGYTEGNINEDIKFINNVRGAYKNGIDIGLYFYSSAINQVEATEEANYVLNLINKYGIRNYISYPIVIDVEDFEGTRNYTLSVQERTNIVKAFCNTIKNAGFKPMLYSYTYFLEQKLYMNQLTSFDTWIADYYGNTWYSRPYLIWQFTDKGQIDGISVPVDLNYSYY